MEYLPALDFKLWLPLLKPFLKFTFRNVQKGKCVCVVKSASLTGCPILEHNLTQTLHMYLWKRPCIFYTLQLNISSANASYHLVDNSSYRDFHFLFVLCSDPKPDRKTLKSMERFNTYYQVLKEYHRWVLKPGINPSESELVISKAAACYEKLDVVETIATIPDNYGPPQSNA